MAWISVHEQVVGGKLRSLAKAVGCSQNEALGILVRLWLWGINNAQKNGLIVDAEKDDVASVLSIGLSKNLDPGAVVDALIQTKWIDFESGLYLHDWEEWQKQWYKALETREKDTERKREERKRKKDGALPINSRQEEKPATKARKTVVENLMLPIPNGEMPKKTEAGYCTEFEEFWKAYPRKVGKGDAYKKYTARIKDGWSPGDLVAAAKNYSSIVARDRIEEKYIKHPKTFLSESTPFQDYLDARPISCEHTETNEEDPYAEWMDSSF